MQHVTLELNAGQRERLTRLINEESWGDVIIRDERVNNDIEYFRQHPGQENQFGDGEMCQECFCRPCITSEDNRQAWWPEAQFAALPAPINSTSRKRLYKKFWTMIYHRGGWACPQYLVKKDGIMQAGNPIRGDGRVKREIMPDCVTTKVRAWYPNAEQQPYMGHRWH